MKIIRPIQKSDYSALHDIAVESGIGFTSLPVNEELLTRKDSIALNASFTASQVEQAGYTKLSVCHGRH